MDEEKARQHWRLSLQLAGWILFAWLITGFGFSIILVDWLNQFSIGGYKLGFWFAQQGAIYIFVALVFIYVRKMAALDDRFNASEGECQEETERQS